MTKCKTQWAATRALHGCYLSVPVPHGSASERRKFGNLAVNYRTTFTSGLFFEGTGPTSI